MGAGRPFALTARRSLAGMQHRYHVMMRRTVRFAAAACAAALALQSACYAYQPVARPLASQHERLRVRLTSDGTTALARDLGPRIALVEGTLDEVSADGALSIAVDWVQSVDGVRQPWTGEGRLSIPPMYVDGVQRHTLQRTRSVVAGVALAGGLVALAVVALRTGGAGGGGDGGTGGPPP